MKNLVKIFSVLMMIVGTFAFGQSKEEMVPIEVPKELLSTKKMTNENASQFKIVNEKKDLLIIFDKESKIVSMSVSRILLEKLQKQNNNFFSRELSVEGGVPPCARKCEDKPTNFGVVLCLYNCLYDELTS